MRTSTKTVEGGSSNGGPGFAGLGLRAELLRALAALGFSSPTPVQAASIPPGLAGHDLLASASTGSGKTAAFLLPILQRLLDTPGRGTRALVLTPTRELAAQIAGHFDLLVKHTRLRCATVYGGVAMQPQEQAFRRGVDLIVATPGRLLDHMQHEYAQLRDIEVLVLDEADRMLDMGFLPDMRRVLRVLPRTPRQTMLFSATMPQPIVELSSELLCRPVRIVIERKAAPAVGITHALYPVPSKRKVDLLLELLQRGAVDDALVFCRTKHRADRLAKRLERQGIEVARIHGNRSQAQRTQALAGFKAGRYRVLVATDIVARGIDIEALGHVINFDVPNAADDYIHRVGRTARAQATGYAFTLVAPEEESEIRSIERALTSPIERRRLDGFDYRAPNEEALEIPIAQRIASLRKQKSEERARATARRTRTARVDVLPVRMANPNGAAKPNGVRVDAPPLTTVQDRGMGPRRGMGRMPRRRT